MAAGKETENSQNKNKQTNKRTTTIAQATQNAHYQYGSNTKNIKDSRAGKKTVHYKEDSSTNYAGITTNNSRQPVGGKGKQTQGKVQGGSLKDCVSATELDDILRGIIALPSDTFFRYRNGKLSRHALRRSLEKATRAKENCLVIVHVKYHWVLMQIQRVGDTKRIFVYDSGRSEVVEKHMARDCAAVGLPPPVFVACPQQIRNSNECGLFAACFAIALSNGWLIPPVTSTRMSLRQHVHLWPDAALFGRAALATLNEAHGGTQHDNDMFVEASVEAMEEALRTFREGDRIAATWRERPAPNGIEVDTHPVTHIGTVIAPWSDTLRGLQRVRWDRGQQRLTPPYNTPFPECHLPDPEIAYAIPLKISSKIKATTATDTAARAPCRTQDEGPVVVRTAATTAARVRACIDDETTRTTPTPPRIVDEPEDTPDDDDYDDDELAPLPDLWTAEAVQTPSFQCGGTRTPEPAAMKGSTLTKIILDETSTPALAKAGLTKQTRQGHRRFIRHLATLPITLHSAPLPTAIVEYINIERRQRRWQWSTTLTRMAAIQGALRLLPLYARHHHPIDLRNDPTWTQAMRTVRRETQCETAFQPRAASPSDIRLAVERESNLQTQCALIVAWITAARGGCTLQLRHENITIDGNQAIIQFRRGKSVIARGPYTVHTTIPPWAITTLTAFVTRRRRGLLFPKTTGEQLKLALRRVHPALEQRSIRRGSLQAMSRGGTSDEDLLLYSGHTNLRTLRRYLDWGRASGDLKRRMPQQAEKAL